ncbi:MAG TPA: hypothetical protein VGA37_07090 [Gemmatimonadales bacterium]
MRPITSAIAALAATLACALPRTGAAQADADSSGAAFAETVRAATAVYHDRSEAIGAGYRLIGPDFRGMGEHWVNVPLLVRRVLDPTRPTILSYATIGGRPTLVGVAFAVPVNAEDSLPAFPIDGAEWHFHSRSVHDESFLPHAMHDAPGDRRLAVVHAWVWLDNPEGVFARNNWALPYARAGLEPPAHPKEDAARALSLVAGNLGYFLTRFRSATADTAAATNAEWVADAAAEVARVLPALDIEERDRDLAAVWRALCVRVGELCHGS